METRKTTNDFIPMACIKIISEVTGECLEGASRDPCYEDGKRTERHLVICIGHFCRVRCLGSDFGTFLWREWHRALKRSVRQDGRWSVMKCEYM